MKNVFKIIAVLTFIVAIVVNIQTGIDENNSNINVEQAFAAEECLYNWDDYTYGFRMVNIMGCEELIDEEWVYIGDENECLEPGHGCITITCQGELPHCRIQPY